MSDDLNRDLPGENGEEDTPDWLKKLETGQLPGDAIGRSKEEDSPPARVPDWLGNPVFEGEPSPIAHEEQDDEVPAWLQGIRETEGTSAPQQEEEAEEEPPDWLGVIPRPQAPEPEEAAESDFVERIQELKAQDGDLFGDDEPEGDPDWLKGLGDDDDEPAFAQQFSPSAEDEDTPDWLTGLDQPESKTQKQSESEDQTGGRITRDLGLRIDDQSIAQAESVDDVFPDLPGEPGAGVENVEEWLASTDTGSLSSKHLRENQEKEPERPSSYEQALAFSADEEFSFDSEELPSWLNEIAPDVPRIEEAEEAAAEDILQAYTPTFDASRPDEPAASGLAPAELPSWLQAMRPVGAVTPAEVITSGKVEGNQETVGPLAGLLGVLPAEPAVVQFGGSAKARSHRLRILDREKHHAAVLKQLVIDEDRPAQLKEEKLPASQYMVRLGIGLAVYIVVLLGMLSGVNLAAYPDVNIENIATDQIRQVHNLVNSSLPENAPVLVAFEYEAGLSAELGGAAAPLIDNLIISGHPLILVSTSPTGPAIAESFLQTNLAKHSYVTEQSYRNLGFLPGEQAGLLGFASAPVQTLPLFYNDGSSWWTYPPLAGIRHIRDFGAVVVISDDAEKAQAWIEQVQPQMVDPDNPAASTPLILVVSAQAETLLRPYTYTTPAQVYGLVAGLKGGAYYDSLLPVENVTREYWDGYGAGITVGFAVILISSTAGFAGSLIRWQAERKENAP
jgi:hypothetical protein